MLPFVMCMMCTMVALHPTYVVWFMPMHIQQEVKLPHVK